MQDESARAQSPVPRATSGVNASIPAPSPLPSGMASKKMSAAEAAVLLREYRKSQYTQLKGLEHRQRSESKELKASQAARLKEWEIKEQAARHKFFEQNQEGPKRREYVKDFIERRKSLQSILADEKTKRTHEQEVRYKSTKDEQAQKLIDFKSYLDRGELPPQELWPSDNR